MSATGVRLGVRASHPAVLAARVSEGPRWLDGPQFLRSKEGPSDFGHKVPVRGAPL